LTDIVLQTAVNWLINGYNAEEINLADLGDNSHVYYFGSPTLKNIQTSGGSTIGKLE
jgi:hypothetical protein